MSELSDSQASNRLDRRGFLKSASIAAVAANFPFVLTSHAAPDDPIRIGLIGCGGRGSGAVANAIEASPNVKVAAVADVFENVARSAAEKYQLDPAHCFSGFDAYQKLLAVPDVNYVILATPPGFRPIHFEAAVNAGKHIFCEKPVAVDAPGIRKFIAAGELARQKQLCVVAGTQRRHQPSYKETIKRIHDGAIGDVLCLRAYWNQNAIWHRGDHWETEMERQVHNWYHYVWLCGDHIVEQHLHNLDVCNWIMNDHPIRAYGQGGRQALGSKSGQIYDHFAVEFEYRNGARLFSQCRQIDGTDGNVSEAVVGTKGFCNKLNDGEIHQGDNIIRFDGPKPNPQVVEHADLMAAVRGAAPYTNDSLNVAHSTMTAIMGRESAYSGQVVQWDEAMAWQTSLMPEKLAWGPVPAVEVAIPGKHQMT
ncbi:MAG TPA: Gfo/Idh/MocA family oxidoreductase [Verrucomicrobiae bacterium]|nr:Gfo/Idh/MocA family oxidoreductase [Verrucomicrobiae bacterium]